MSSPESQDIQLPSDIPQSGPATREQYDKFIDIHHYQISSLLCAIRCKVVPTSQENQARIDKILEISAQQRAKLGLPFGKTYAFPERFNEKRALSEFHQNFNFERASRCLEKEEAFIESLKQEHWGEGPFPPGCNHTRPDPNKKVESANSDLAVSDRLKSAPGRATILQYYDLDDIFDLYDELEGTVRSMPPGGQMDPAKQAVLDKVAEYKRTRLEEIGLCSRLNRLRKRTEHWPEFKHFSAKYSEEEAGTLLKKENDALEKWRSELGLGRGSF